MSKPTPDLPPNSPNNLVNSDDAMTDNPSDNSATTSINIEPVDTGSNTSTDSTDEVVIAPIQGDESVAIPAAGRIEDKAPFTDISLISQQNKPREYKKDNPSFFMQRGYQILLVLGLIAAFLLVMVYQTLFGRIEQPAKKITIEAGDTYYGLVSQWQQQIPLFSASIAKLYIKSQVDGELHAGIYPLPENPTIAEALHILGQGAKVAMVKVQIIEGKTSKDLYQNLRDNPGITKEILTKDADNKSIAEALDLVGVLPDSVINSDDPIVRYNLEGWFTPDTYYYAEGATDKQVLTDLYKRQQQALTKAWDNRAPDLPYNSPYEALVMASIIEKETSVASERPLVSAVFNNRLNQGMRMQTDPTIIYGMGSRYNGNIRRADINEKTGYNTYQIDGLPPTPIALPSAASIEATLHPADSEVLYFVATGTGGHKFTNSLAEHNQAVQDYLKVMREKKSQIAPKELTE